MATSDDNHVPAVPGYTIEKKLAQGGMGVVYVATDDALGRRVAIKMIRADVVGSTSDADDEKVAVTRFMNEARAAAQIKSAHVATVLTFGQTKVGDLYLVLEYLDGLTLTDVLKREKRLDVDRALRITQRVCRGLKAAHALGIVHRDLKPSNVMLVEQDGDPEFVKILDFGVAKKLSDRESDVTRTGALIGTHTSMAPEQITGAAVDARTDIYAIGCLLFRLLTGKAPFQADDFVAVLHAHLHRPPPKPSSLRNDGSIPAMLDTLVVRCLAKDPNDRVPSTTELERLIGAVLERDPSAVLSSADASAPTALHVDMDFPTATPWQTVDVDTSWSSSKGALAAADAAQSALAEPHTPMTGSRVASAEVAAALASGLPEQARSPWARIAVGALMGSIAAFAIAVGMLWMVLARDREPAKAAQTSTTEPPVLTLKEAPPADARPDEPSRDAEPEKPIAPDKGEAGDDAARVDEDADDVEVKDPREVRKLNKTSAKSASVKKPKATKDVAKPTSGSKKPDAVVKKPEPKASSTPAKPDAKPVVKPEPQVDDKEERPRADFRRVRTTEDQ
jgi:serine/threonine protein kinase